jgi:hypothetical protein
VYQQQDAVAFNGIPVDAQSCTSRYVAWSIFFSQSALAEPDRKWPESEVQRLLVAAVGA